MEKGIFSFLRATQTLPDKSQQCLKRITGGPPHAPCCHSHLIISPLHTQLSWRLLALMDICDQWDQLEI